jgi:glutathione S-transferase
MKLYEFGPTRSIRARWTLQELGLDFEAITVNLAAGEHRSPEFLKINPAGKIPVLIDGDLVLTESIAIVMHLGEKYIDKGLVPRDLAQRAEMNKWLLFAATELEQPLWRISKNTALYPEDKRQPTDVLRAREDFAPMAAVLEEHLKGREFIVGNTATIADFVMAYTLDWANELNDAGRFPAPAGVHGEDVRAAARGAAYRGRVRQPRHRSIGELTIPGFRALLAGWQRVRFPTTGARRMRSVTRVPNSPAWGCASVPRASRISTK